MSRLLNMSRDNNVIVSHVKVAKGFFARNKGLLGESRLDENTALWIHACNSIHTFFMRFAIDAVFVDRGMVVRAKYENLVPWRVTMPAWRASSVFELPAGTLRRQTVEIGDRLHVGD